MSIGLPSIAYANSADAPYIPSSKERGFTALDDKTSKEKAGNIPCLENLRNFRYKKIKMMHSLLSLLKMLGRNSFEQNLFKNLLVCFSDFGRNIVCHKLVPNGIKPFCS